MKTVHCTNDPSRARPELTGPRVQKLLRARNVNRCGLSQEAHTLRGDSAEPAATGISITRADRTKQSQQSNLGSAHHATECLNPVKAVAESVKVQSLLGMQVTEEWRALTEGF